MKGSKFFKPRKIKDPRTGKIRIVTAEEQLKMLEKGILFDIASEPAEEKDLDKNHKSK